MTRACRTPQPPHTLHAVLVVAISLVPSAAWSQSPSALPRVRSENASIAELIATGVSGSETFRSLVEGINGTNGMVYVESGQCGHGVQACLAHSIRLAGPHRILRVVVSLRRERMELIGAIGHELQHALEVLSDQTITTGPGMFFHLYGMSMNSTSGRFETTSALQAGNRIERELRLSTASARR